MFQKVRNLFNRKRIQSEYLKFEDGDIISIDKVNKSDKSPRLDIHKKTESNNIQDHNVIIKTKNNLEKNNEKDINKKKLIDKILLYAIIAFIVALAIYLFDLSKIFLDKTNDYMTTGKVAEVQNQSNIIKEEKNSNTGTLKNNQLEVIPEPTKSNNKLMDLLELVVQSNNVILTNYKNAKTEVIYYSDSKSTKYLLDSAFNKIENNIEQSQANLSQYESDFTKAELKALYDIQIVRLNNLKALVSETKKMENREDSISITNKHINKENELVRKQANSFIAILKKYHIPYTNQNGYISYTIK
ncbi:TPA: hypothetical protein N2D99_002444 [Clostridium botulinum]|nr:hypothetical protein [Clostridium botulinum]